MSSKAAQKVALFIKEYLTDFNGTRSAIAAGYAERSAHVAASRLLKKDNVKAQIAAQVAERAAKLDITADGVLEGLRRLAFFDPRKFFNPDGSLIPVAELDEETAYALQGTDVEKLYKHFAKGAAQEVGTVSKIKFADRGINLERLGRYLKLFTDRVEVSGMDGVADILAKARKRAHASG